MRQPDYHEGRIEEEAVEKARRPHAWCLASCPDARQLLGLEFHVPDFFAVDLLANSLQDGRRSRLA
jgi:hypothetical protein